MISISRSPRFKHGVARRTLISGRSAAAVLSAVVAGTGLTAVVAHPAIAASYAQATASFDDFSRTDEGGWGQPDSGGTYTLRGQTSAFSVSAGTGTIDRLQPGASAEAYLPGVSTADTIVQSTVAVTPSDSSRWRVYSGVEARRQGDGTAYRGKLMLDSSGATALAISRTQGAEETRLGSVSLAGTAASAQPFWLQMMVLGSDPVVVKVRTWSVGGSTPAWQVAVTDSSSSRISGAGSPGIWDYVSTSSSPTTLLHDQFTTTRLTGEESTDPSTSSAPSAPTPTSAPAAPPTAVAAVGSATVYKAANFDNMPIGSVSPSAFNAALGRTNTNAGAYDDMTVIADGRGGRAIRTTLLAGTYFSAPKPEGGDNLFINLPTSYDSACIQYDLRFDSNFDWSLGGKLPGLEGVVPGVAPGTPTGGNVTTLGWSGRMMWLTPKSYSWAGPTNMAVSYLYHPGQLDRYGDNIRWNKSFVAGRWHTVKQCYTMNTVGRADGILLAWFDGTQVVNDQSFVYRTRGDIHINYLDFSIFRGGNTTAWAGSRTGTIDVDNVVVSSR